MIRLDLGGIKELVKDLGIVSSFDWALNYRGPLVVFISMDRSNGDPSNNCSTYLTLIDLVSMEVVGR